VKATGIRPAGANRTRRKHSDHRLSAARRRRPRVRHLVDTHGTSGFTGVLVTVPACPPDVDGCRVFVTSESDGTVAAHKDWTGGDTTVSIVLSPRRYAVSAEGCTGDELENSVITVTPGDQAVIDLGSSWQMPAFVDAPVPGSSQPHPLSEGADWRLS